MDGTEDEINAAGANVAAEQQRAGAAWTPDEDAVLAEELAGGTEAAQIATALGRTLGAVRARAALMLPDDPSVPRGRDGLAWLRVRLQRHGYDWQAALYGASRSQLIRAWEPWSHQEHAQLVDELRAGLTWDDIAAAHGRTRQALRTRAALLLDPDDETLPRSNTKRAELLREQLAQHPDYDWATWLQAYQARSGAWSETDDAVVRAGWDDATALATWRPL